MLSKSISKRLAHQRPKKKAKTLSQLKKQAWDLLSQCIRREAANHAGEVECYTCRGTWNWLGMQAGHAIGGRHNSVLLNELIIRPQCCGCNIFKRGNYQEFITRLVEENSFAWWQIRLAESKLTVKFSRADLEEKIETYKERMRSLE